MPDIKVVSYNIRRAKGIDGQKDIKRVFEVLDPLAADIIALQEVEMRPGIARRFKQARVLAEWLNMNYVYGPVHRLSLGTVGNAVLSRYPIVKETRHVLIDSRGERGCLQADIDADGTPFSIFNTHLGLNGTLRYRHLKDIILPAIEACSIPAVLAGDMNAAPGTPEIQMICANLYDTYQDNSGSLVSTYTSESPRVRIDYIFIDDKADCTGYNIRETLASDHLPVVADIRLP